MIINFFHPHMKPVVECDKIASEGYEVSNLISTNQDLNEKGFLAERFISLPVFINIKFICPININTVIIWTKVSNQKSLGFEILTLRKCINKSLISVNEDDFKRLAFCILSSDTNGVRFFKEGFNINCNKHSEEVKLFSPITFYRGKNHENVISLKIKIFKSHYVPAIKRIEIWGEPYCNLKMNNYVLKLWSEINSENSVPILNEKTESETQQNKVNETKNFNNNYGSGIPDEFYDEITQEIMTLPVILPSGKIIDQSTLEKFQNEEKKWGRALSDPFTGLLFTEKRKPIIATSLKAKIDKFLLKNPNLDQIKTLPRRLGSADSTQPHCETGLYKISRVIDTGTNKKKNTKTINDDIDVKKFKLSTSEITKFDNSDKALEKLLETSLSNLPSFLNNSREYKPKSLKCTKCHIENKLYILPCCHILCRSCIVQNNNNCAECNKKCTFSEIQKIHSNVKDLSSNCFN